ncbi:MAG: relaxase/mobilization nuclease domain-containing protein [Clostridia bacterium]|nr:relaxase/mobilization nuclease domain-containing protein [Clostridia bacterium]
MATTKIWAIKDSLSRVVNYAKNPKKTIFSDLKQVLKYAENDEKTIDGNEKTMYVTGVNCKAKTAYEEMTAVQNRFDKCTGNIAYHAYQSFKTGEVSPELAHKIGVELAEKMWSEYQVVVTTHFNTGTYHNHFVVNSVNMFIGKKFNCNKGAYYHFRELSDEICREYGLTVIEKPTGKTPRSIYFAEKRGEPTKYNLMRQAMDEAMKICVNYAQFKKIMYKKGYIINDDNNRKYPTIRSINDKKTVRMYQLGEKYLPKNIANKVKQNPYYYQDGYMKFIRPQRKNKNYTIYNFKGSFKDISKMSGIDVLFLILFHLLGLIPKQENYKPLSPEMRREIRKMERYCNETRLIATENLRTVDDVKKYILQTEKDIVDITDISQKCRNKLRNCTNENLIKEYKGKRDDCTITLNKYRKNLKIANWILEDTPKVREVIKIEQQMKREQEDITKTKKKDRTVR